MMMHSVMNADRLDADMADNQTYNGWTNYPTWCVSLWIDNDEGTYGYSRELVAQVIEDSNDKAENCIYEIAQALESWAEDELLPEIEGFSNDLLSWAFGMVNWREIAENYASELTNG